jgi:hypothetical protein
VPSPVASAASRSSAPESSPSPEPASSFGDVLAAARAALQGAPAPSAATSAPSGPSATPPPPAETPPATAPPVAPPAEAAPSAPPEPPRSEAAPRRGKDLPPSWEDIVTRVHAANPALGAVFQHGVPLHVDAALLHIAFPPGSFFGAQAEAGAPTLAQIAGGLLGGRPRVKLSVAEAGVGPQTLAERDEAARQARLRAVREEALSHPLVKDASRLFDLSPETLQVRLAEE